MTNRRFPIAEFFALVQSFVFFCCLFLVLFGSGFDFTLQVLLISGGIAIVYLAAFISVSIRTRRYSARRFAIRDIIVIAGIALLLTAWLIKTVWFSGYLNLFAYNTLFAGQTNPDTLAHVAISESLKNYGVPSLLIEGITRFSYHYGSHLIMAVMSWLTRVPVFAVYNYLYPSIFVPLFFYLLIRLMQEIRTFSGETAVLNPFDLPIVMIGLTGFLPTFLMDRFGFGHSTLFISESFLVSLDLMLLLAWITFRMVNLDFASKVSLHRSYFWLILPIFIFACAATKISVGFLVAAAGTYAVLRTLKPVFQRLATALFYILIFCGCYLLFHESGNSSIRLFDYFRQYTRWGTLLYIISEYSFAGLFIWYQVRTLGGFASAFANNRYLAWELLLLISILGALPGMLLWIRGGSASYFSQVQLPLSIALVVGSNCITHIISTVKRSIALKVLMAVLMVVVIGNSISPDLLRLPLARLSLNIASNDTSAVNRLKTLFFQDYIPGGFLHKLGALGAMTRTKKLEFIDYLGKLIFSPNIVQGDGFKELLDQINTMTRYSKREYVIYLEPDSNLFRLYGNNLRAQSYFVQAYTGLVVINMFRIENGTIYTAAGQKISGIASSLYFGLDRNAVEHSPYRGIGDAIDFARSRGFKFVIQFGMEIRIIKVI